VVLADEPTANLDSQASEYLMELFLKLNAEHKVTFVIATHDTGVMAYARRLVRLRDGRIVGDELQAAAAAAD
jgi:putative ABC transport system ATP-binding protein